jgi:hypothetical protein
MNIFYLICSIIAFIISLLTVIEIIRHKREMKKMNKSFYITKYKRVKEDTADSFFRSNNIKGEE